MTLKLINACSWVLIIIYIGLSACLFKLFYQILHIFNLLERLQFNLLLCIKLFYFKILNNNCSLYIKRRIVQIVSLWSFGTWRHGDSSKILSIVVS